MKNIASALMACTVAGVTLLSSPLPSQELRGDSTDLPPAGYGTLRQDDISLTFQTANLTIQVIPLEEGIIRLLTPDNYGSFHRMRERKQEEIDEAIRRTGIDRPILFLVTFFGKQQRARFREEELTIISRNRFFRPLATIPITPTWGQQELNQRETARAVYLFEPGIRLNETFEISYEGRTGARWDERKLLIVDRERSRVMSRASGQ